MAVTELFAGVAVADYDAALEWYERLLGGPPAFHPNDNEAVWQLAEHRWIYVVGDADRAGHALVTVLVDDLEARVPGLCQRGIDTEIRDTIPGIRQAVVTDPEGNRITFGQPVER
jgi:catechol 2,3-dioxygenase-like lactoylglutathione lyase family enzyme